MSLRERVARTWVRHRTLFWTLHSVWVLATGTLIVMFARERYHLVLWVVLFLALAWASTLYFGRAAIVEAGTPPGLVHEVASYLTRHLYQETLFFLLPFYAYSTVIGSPNVLFLVLLGGLAVLSCVDLLFDHWLRTRPEFGLMFFAVVTFAAINLLLPLVLGIRPRFAAPAAALLSIGSAVPLALRTAQKGPGIRLRLTAAAVVLLAVAVGLPGLIPPVPLRMKEATFASGIDSETLALADTLSADVSAAELGGSIFVLVEVFAPSALPAHVRLEWRRDGEIFRLSREVSIIAHAGGFRVWDAWHAPSGSIASGRYRVVLRTSGRRVFGVATLTVDG
ncbi:MAG: DUF5924 family protein [Longimicrobiales bacterium]|nr:DUF5924 family protein [Longimicrobiales bacterium]